MKDGGVKACVAMVCVTAIYGMYVMANAIAGQPIPDGIMLTAVVGVTAGLGGYAVAAAKALKPS